MGAAIRIAILANAARARAEMQSVGKEGSRLGSVLKGGLGVAAAGAGVALGAMFAGSIAGARESAQIHRVLESQIKNMGGAARVAFKDATGFAEDYGKAIGKDDDDILKVVNKLSTFPAAFGKGTLGAEGMRRATQAAFDLEAAGIGSAEGNIIGLGKALDNPIKGLTALSKSGVSFTAEQKQQIQNYVKQGKLAEAQKVLLAGIETNAKGAATKTADGLTRAKVALDGFAEGLATKALPFLDRFGTFFVDKALPAIQTGLKSAGAALQAFVGFLGNPVVQTFGAAILAIVVALKIYNTVLAAIRIATTAYAAVQAVLNVVLTANPIGLIILAVVGLAAAIVVAYKRSETFRRIVNAAFSGALRVIRAVWGWIKSNWPLLLAIITGPVGLAVRFVVTHFGQIVAFVRSIPGKIKAVFGGVKTLLTDAGRNIVNGLIRGIEEKFEAVRAKLRQLTNLLPDWKGPASRDGKILRKSGQLVVGGFLDGLESRYAAVRASLGGFTGSLTASSGLAAGLAGDATIRVDTAPGAAQQPIILSFEATGDPVMDAVFEAMRKRVRVAGGNVQAVLGRA
jgi:hypothetical protein